MKHVPQTESSFLTAGHKAVCSCGWRAQEKGSDKVYTTAEAAERAAQAHARQAAG